MKKLILIVLLFIIFIMPNKVFAEVEIPRTYGSNELSLGVNLTIVAPIVELELEYRGGDLGIGVSVGYDMEGDPMSTGLTPAITIGGLLKYRPNFLRHNLLTANSSVILAVYPTIGIPLDGSTVLFDIKAGIGYEIVLGHFKTGLEVGYNYWYCRYHAFFVKVGFSYLFF